MRFLTRKRDGQVFPTDTSGKEYRTDYDFSAKSKDPKPAFGTKSNTSQDIRKITDSATDRDSKTYDSKVSKQNYKRYRRNTNDKMNRQFQKSNKRAKRKQQKAEKKRDKQQIKIEKSEIDKQLKDTEQKAKREYAEEQKEDAETREEIATFEGNR